MLVATFNWTLTSPPINLKAEISMTKVPIEKSVKNTLSFRLGFKFLIST